MKFGSHLYGLNTSQSDIDWMGVYLPTLQSLLLGNYTKTFNLSTGGSGKNKATDIDLEIMALPRFIELACRSASVAIDMLHSTQPIFGEGEYDFIWNELVSRRTEFYTKKLKSFIDYGAGQAAKYSIKSSKLLAIENVYNAATDYITMGKYSRLAEIIHKLPSNEYCKITISGNPTFGIRTFYEMCGRKYQDSISITSFIENVKKICNSYGARVHAAKNNENIDWKGISHALRMAYQARAIYIDGDFEYPLKETPFIMDVKQCKLDFMTQVNPVLVDLIDEVKVLSEKSSLQERVDRSKWDTWLLDIYAEVYGVKMSIT